MKKRHILQLILTIASLGFTAPLTPTTIEEKLASLSDTSSEEGTEVALSLKKLNPELKQLKSKLHHQYKQLSSLIENGEKENKFQELLSEINIIRSKIRSKEALWRQKAVDSQKIDNEGYGLWDQEQTTLSQLIMEYGSGDYLYVIPPEIAQTKISLHSGIPIPRESWSDLITIVLSQNGIGIKEVNPFTRQLYILKSDLLGVKVITGKKSHLEKVDDHERVAFLFSPKPENYKSAFHFLDRFRDPKRMFTYSVGNKIAIVASKEEVLKLVDLYKTVWDADVTKTTKVVSCSKIGAAQMHTILKTFFGGLNEPDRAVPLKGVNDISIMPLANENSLVLVGSSDLISKAESVIQNTESQIQLPSEMTIHWYQCRHSNPNDLSDLLEKVYASLGQVQHSSSQTKQNNNVFFDFHDNFSEGGGPPDNGKSSLVVDPPSAVPGTIESQIRKSDSKHFIPYPKTGSIMMVVRKDLLPKIKELVKKLDVPKKMVQIEVLLCEKKLNSQTNTGLNILRMGRSASNTHSTGVDFNASSTASITGLFEFFISREKTRKNIPAYDVTYNFLMSQENIRVNASPSVLTLNQTPAKISLVEEVSVNNGAAPIETNSNITFEKSFTRAQFGITIVVTPTVHEADEDDPHQSKLVTLETDVTFDTQKSDVDDRPKVDRRHIQNHVRVIDGQTVILAGLRRKTADDTSQKIPFLGELPGFGKLFGSSVMTDNTTEMFIFITPRVIEDPRKDIEMIFRREKGKRPGDRPEYLCRLMEAKDKKKRKLFEQSFKLLFGNMND